VPTFEADVPSAEGAEFLAPPDDFEVRPAAGDLEIRWSPTTDDDVYLDLALGFASITCTFPASRGHAVIPRALVDESIAGYREEGVSFLFLASIRSVHAAAGDHDILIAHGVGTTKRARVVR
jgi:hypothetical protein